MVEKLLGTCSRFSVLKKKRRNSQQTPRRKSMHARSHASKILPGP